MIERLLELSKRLNQVLLLGIFALPCLCSENAPKLVVQLGHSAVVTSVDFDGEGRLLVSGSADNSVKLWEIETGRELRTMSRHTDRVTAVAFSLLEAEIASGGDDRLVVVWDAKTGAPKCELSHPSAINSLSFSRTGKILAVGTKSGTVHLWNVLEETCSSRFSPLQHSFGAVTVRFSPDGQFLATGGEDRLVNVLNLTTSKILRNEVDAAIYSLDLNKNSLAAIGTVEGKILLWNILRNETRFFSAHSLAVTSLSFAKDGDRLASVGFDNAIRLWSVNNGGAELPDVTRQAFGAAAIKFSPKGHTLASGAGDATIKLWHTGRSVRQPPMSLSGNSTPITALTFCNGGLLALGRGNGNIHLWSLREGTPRVLTGSRAITALSCSPEGKTLVSGSESKKVTRWDISTGKLVYSKSGHLSWVTKLTFNQNGILFASSGKDTTIAIWDTFRGTIVRKISAHSSWILAVAFSPTDNILVSGGADSGGDDRTTIFWRYAAQNGEASFNPNPMKRHRDGTGPKDFSFSSNGKLLAAANANFVTVWDILNQILLFEVEMFAGVTSVAFSPNDNYVFFATTDGRVGVLDLNSKNFRIMGTHDTSVSSLSFDKKSRILASGGRDGKVKLWRFDPNNGSNTELLSLIPLKENDWIAVCPDGRFDTSLSLEDIKGLHWIMPDSPFTALSVEVFMRQYYEPSLLQRVLTGEQLKPLPPIAELNRVQPKVVIKEIKSPTGAADLVDVTVEVESMMEDGRIGATDRSEPEKLYSGAFDLRLFRDGQLVGVSTPKDKLAAFINDAPRLVAETKASGRLLDTPEDRAWQEANDIFKLKGDIVKLIASTKVSYTFRNLKLPRDGRKEVAFTAYAFNKDRVKSTTTEPYRFAVPNDIAASPKKGRAFLISIGVNASEILLTT